MKKVRVDNIKEDKNNNTGEILHQRSETQSKQHSLLSTHVRIRIAITLAFSELLALQMS